MAPVAFATAFKYPFNKAARMWNILWMFVPVFGWLALGGYSVRIVQEFSKGKFKHLPNMQFGSDMNLGFFMFLKAMPFMLAYIIVITLLVMIDPWLRLAGVVFEIFAIPILGINFLNKQTVSSFFEFKIVRAVIDNLGDYIVVLLKSIALGVIFFLMYIILVGIPAGTFTKNIFLADFYRRNVK